jgi:hypothetical protein
LGRNQALCPIELRAHFGATNRIRTGNQGVADPCLGRLAMVATSANLQTNYNTKLLK